MESTVYLKPKMGKIAFSFNMPEVMDKYFDLVMEQDFNIELQQSPQELKNKGYKYVVISGEFTYQFCSSASTSKLLYWPENVVQYHQELEDLDILAIYWDHRPLRTESSDEERENVRISMQKLKKLLTEELEILQDFIQKWRYIYQVIFTNRGIKFHRRKINLAPEEKQEFAHELACVMGRLY